MRRFAIILCAALGAPSMAQAAQGAIEFTPLVTPGKPLTVEVRNLSKLPVNLKEANLEFAAGNAAGPPCRMSLPAPVSLGPAEMKAITLGESDGVARCMPQPPGAAQARVFVMRARELTSAQPVPADIGNAVLHPADLTYSIEIGGRAFKEKATWLFGVQ
jgi:hypothetical protein